jgi:molybdopterin-guanine dinucleotide biosynthesis protein A
VARFDDVSGLILDGGKATRLSGVDKAFLEIGGRTIAARTVELFQGLFCEVVVSTNRPAPWRGLPVRCVADEVADAGPLAGLAAGLAACRAPLAFVAAGDMPSLSEAVVVHLVERARCCPGQAVVATLGGRPEPLHAAYPTLLAGAARAALASGARRITDLLDRVPVTWVDESEVVALPGGPDTFRNVNDPADLDAAARA